MKLGFRHGSLRMRFILKPRTAEGEVGIQAWQPLCRLYEMTTFFPLRFPMYNFMSALAMVDSMVWFL